MEKVNSSRLCFLHFYTRRSIFRFIIATFSYSKFNAQFYKSPVYETFCKLRFHHPLQESHHNKEGYVFLIDPPKGVRDSKYSYKQTEVLEQIKQILVGIQ